MFENIAVLILFSLFQADYAEYHFVTNSNKATCKFGEASISYPSSSISICIANCNKIEKNNCRELNFNKKNNLCILCSSYNSTNKNEMQMLLENVNDKDGSSDSFKYQKLSCDQKETSQYYFPNKNDCYNKCFELSSNCHGIQYNVENKLCDICIYGISGNVFGTTAEDWFNLYTYDKQNNREINFWKKNNTTNKANLNCGKNSTESQMQVISYYECKRTCEERNCRKFAFENNKKLCILCKSETKDEKNLNCGKSGLEIQIQVISNYECKETCKKRNCRKYAYDSNKYLCILCESTFKSGTTEKKPKFYPRISAIL